VKVSILSGSGPDRATLSGTRSRNGIGGVAAFNDLVLNKAGAGYILVAESGGLSVQSAPFTVGAPVIGGDLDVDGIVTMKDVDLALKIAAGLLEGASAGISVASGDVNSDGVISLSDAAAIRGLMR
jgi:hypothetical protein